MKREPLEIRPLLAAQIRLNDHVVLAKQLAEQPLRDPSDTLVLVALGDLEEIGAVVVVRRSCGLGRRDRCRMT